VIKYQRIIVPQTKIRTPKGHNRRIEVNRGISACFSGFNGSIGRYSNSSAGVCVGWIISMVSVGRMSGVAVAVSGMLVGPVSTVSVLDAGRLAVAETVRTRVLVPVMPGDALAVAVGVCVIVGAGVSLTIGVGVLV